MVVIVTDKGIADSDYPSGYSVIPSGLQYSTVLSACILVIAIALIVLIIERSARKS